MMSSRTLINKASHTEGRILVSPWRFLHVIACASVLQLETSEMQRRTRLALDRPFSRARARQKAIFDSGDAH